MGRFAIALALPVFLLLSCATSLGIKPIYSIQSASLIKGEIAVKTYPYEGAEGKPNSLGATRLDGRVDDFFSKALHDELAAFGFTVADDARLELSMTIQKAATTWSPQGDEGVYGTAIELRFILRDRLKGDAIVYDRVHTGNVSHSQRFGGYMASASLVDALAQTYGRLLSDAGFYDKLVKEYGYSKSSKVAQAAAGGPGSGDALELWSSSVAAFPVLLKFYDDHPVGKAVIRNRLGVPVSDLRLSLFVPSYMDAPKECAELEELKDRAEVDLFALFDGRIMSVTEGAKAAATLGAEYAVDGAKYSQALPLTVRILNRNAIVWDDDRKAASFVTALDPIVLGFAKGATGMLSGIRAGEISRNILKAAILHEALVAHRMSYEIDPYSSYTTAKGTTTLDYLQFPRQTLEYRSGDCDDLSVLYCALLESVGVETAFITTPGHIYAAFDSGIEPARIASAGSGRSNYPSEYILLGGKAWIPVEATVVKDDFLRAWQTGSEEWARQEASGGAALLPTRDAWKTYEAAGFSEIGAAISPPDRSALLPRFADVLERFVDREISPAAAALREEISAKKGSAQPINKLALLYARYGRYGQALIELEGPCDAGYLPALINSGNICILDGEFAKAKGFLERAYARAPNDSVVVLQLAKALYALKDFSASDAMYGRLKAIDGKLAGAYAYLERAGGGKASEAAEPVPWRE
jgi:hypothetical protein